LGGASSSPSVAGDPGDEVVGPGSRQRDGEQPRGRPVLGARVEPLEPDLRGLAEVDRLDAQPVAARDDELLDAPAAEQHLERRERGEPSRGRRQRTEAVDELGLEAAHALRIADRREPPVEVEARVSSAT
jgi:hypothetical protein